MPRNLVGLLDKKQVTSSQIHEAPYLVRAIFKKGEIGLFSNRVTSCVEMAKKKRRYVAGLAQLDFQPSYDWEIEEAEQLYTDVQHSIPTEEIHYRDCVVGMQSLPDRCIDLVIADPPFGIDFSGKEAQYNRKSEFVAEGYSEITEDYDKFTDDWVNELPRIMKETASAYIFSGWTNLSDLLVAVDKSPLTLINHIIWKYQFGVFTKKKYVTSHYHCLYVVKNPKKYFFNKIEHYPLDVWDIPRKYIPGQRKNGTKLPEDVIIRALDFSSRPGDLIFDPFMGNGTTAVCARLTYRHYFGFEINTQMRDIINDNLATVTLGARYQAYHTLLPTPEELARKYPGVRRKLETNKTPENQ
ncbi:MAG: DNA-methyltransferase [Candidatus Thorarchaeota archaeon]